MNKLPKYFIVQRDRDNPLWKKYIDWLNTTYKVTGGGWGGTVYDYYGYDGTDSNGGTRGYDTPRCFQNNPTLLTLEQWDEAVNGFKLPADWYVVITKENREKVMEYFNLFDECRGCSYSMNAAYGLKSGLPVTKIFSSDIPPSCTEITSEQFLTYVVGKPETSFTLPAKWCIRMDRQEVVNYANKYGEMPPYHATNLYAHFPAFKERCTTDREVNVGYTEITFEQFKQHVMKQLPNNTEEYNQQFAEFKAKYPVGTQVKVLSTAASRTHGWNNSWVSPDMDRVVGKTLTIADYSGTGVVLSQTYYCYPFFILQPTTTVNQKITMANQKITRENLKEIYGNVCSDWQGRIDIRLRTTSAFSNTVEVTEDEISRAFGEANSTQRALLKKYFTIPEEFNSSMLEIGEMMTMTSGQHSGDILLRTYDNFVNLNKPRSTWSSSPGFLGKKLPKGTAVNVG